MVLRLELNEGNKYIHQYPLGIYDGMEDATNHPYRAMLSFVPIKVDGQTISKFAGTDLGLFNIGKKSISNLMDIFAPDRKKDKESSDIDESSLLEFKDKGMLADLKTIEPIEHNDDFGEELTQRAYLYMPMSVQQMENVAVGPESLGVVGGTIQSVIQGGDATLTGITAAGARGAVGGVMDFVSGNASRELGSLIANKIASRLNTQAGVGVQNATRLQISPNTRAIFKQVNIREWSFSFQLIPTNEKESIEIENIIDFFRSEQLPEELGTGGISMAYRFPNLMRIRAYYFLTDNRKPNSKNEFVDVKRIITRFLPAYLQSVDVTYNTSSMSFYEGGKFHDATLNLKFIEYRPLNKQDIRTERKYLGRGKVGNTEPRDFS
tara:strand:- start:2348 stop:3484 length:1137 start_codon:yes stop_codon:yes gene_type:complete